MREKIIDATASAIFAPTLLCNPQVILNALQRFAQSPVHRAVALSVLNSLKNNPRNKARMEALALVIPENRVNGVVNEALGTAISFTDARMKATDGFLSTMGTLGGTIYKRSK